jgi:hypothetical protein
VVQEPIEHTHDGGVGDGSGAGGEARLMRHEADEEECGVKATLAAERSYGDGGRSGRGHRRRRWRGSPIVPVKSIFEKKGIRFWVEGITPKSF